MTAKSDGKQQLSQQADGKLALEQNSFPVVIVGFGCARLNHHSERTVVRSLFILLADGCSGTQKDMAEFMMSPVFTVEWHEQLVDYR